MDKEIFEYKTTPKSRFNRYRMTRWVNCMDSRRNTILLESHGILNSFTSDFDRITRRYVKNTICPILTIEDENYSSIVVNSTNIHLHYL